jgi:hypothetical protein
MKRQKLYLLSVLGPEWNDPVGVWVKKKAAKRAKAKMNLSLKKSTDPMLRMSSAYIVKVGVHGKLRYPWA